MSSFFIQIIFCSYSLCLYFLLKEYWRKVARKNLMKLTPDCRKQVIIFTPFCRKPFWKWRYLAIHSFHDVPPRFVRSWSSTLAYDKGQEAVVGWNDKRQLHGKPFWKRKSKKVNIMSYKLEIRVQWTSNVVFFIRITKVQLLETGLIVIRDPRVL